MQPAGKKETTQPGTRPRPKSGKFSEVGPVHSGNCCGLRPKLRDQAEADVVKLALAIARRVVPSGTRYRSGFDRQARKSPALSKLHACRRRCASEYILSLAQATSVREMLSRSDGSAH